MAFMMPVMKNDWDIYNARSRKTSEGTEKGGTAGVRVRKVSECRSEGPAGTPRVMLSPHRSAPAMSPNRSAPTMRSVSYYRAPPSRSSTRGSDLAAKTPHVGDSEKFHTRLVDKLKRVLTRSVSRDERTT